MKDEEKRFREQLLRKATEWMVDGNWVGVFENKDMGHSELGRRIAVPFDMTEWDKAVVGSTTAPDHPTIGVGWRYILTTKCETVEDVMKEMTKNG